MPTVQDRDDERIAHPNRRQHQSLNGDRHQHDSEDGQYRGRDRSEPERSRQREIDQCRQRDKFPMGEVKNIRTASNDLESKGDNRINKT